MSSILMVWLPANVHSTFLLIQEWSSQRQLLIFVVAINVSLAAVFWNLLRHSWRHSTGRSMWRHHSSVHWVRADADHKQLLPHVVVKSPTDAYRPRLRSSNWLILSFPPRLSDTVQYYILNRLTLDWTPQLQTFYLHVVFQYFKFQSWCKASSS